MELSKLYITLAVTGVEQAKADINDVTDTTEKSSNKMSKFGSIMKGIGKGVLVATGAVAKKYQVTTVLYNKVSVVLKLYLVSQQIK